MPLNNDPHFYDSFAGFDTSTLYSNGAFAAGALTSGTGGKAIADAVAAVNFANHVTATNNAIALIRKVALDNGVSPVTSLVTFIHQLVALNHDTNLVQYVGFAFVSLINAGIVTATNTASQATAAAIAIAQSGDTANAVAAGSELAVVLSQVRVGGGDGQSSYPSAIAQIQAAIGGTLTVNQAIDMLVGMPLGSAGAGSDSQSALHTLVGSDPTKATHAITAFATHFAANPHDEAWTYIGQVAGWVGFSTTDTNAVVTGLIGSTLTAAQAVVLLSQLSGGAQAIAALISGGTISASDAFAALATYAASVPSTSESSAATSALIAVAAVSPVDFAVQMAAASAFAGLIGVTIDVNSAINMIANNAQLTPEASLSMLAAVGALGNVLSQTNNRYSLQLIGDAIYADMNNGLSATAAVAALAAGFTALGLSVDQQVTILAGAGGIAVGFQLVGDPNLKAAAAAQIYSLIQANSGHLTAQQLATDFASAMTSQNIFWPQIIDILVRVAGSDSTVSGLVGAALADLIGLSPFASSIATARVIQYIHADSVFPNQIITGAQTTGILIGMAGTGGIAIQVAAGGELGSLMGGAGFGAAGAAAITAALAANTLTTSQATLFLAGAAGNSNSILIKGISQNAYTNLLASLVSDNGATSITAVHGAVVASALTADKALFFLAALGANSTGATQIAAANEILALATGGLVDAAHAVGVLAGAAGTVGSVTALFLPGFTVGSQGYNDLLNYQNIFQETIGAQIALLTTTPASGLSAQAAVDAIDAAVTAHKLTGADAIRVLMSAAASDAAIEPLAQAEILNLIGAGTITSAQAVAVLQGMLTGASTALQTVVTNELGLLIVDFNTLDATAGTGNSAQIKAAAIAIETLLNGSPTDQTNGQTVLNHLSGRITGATLTSAGAIELLLDLAGRGTVGLNAAIATLQTLSTPIGQGFGIIRYDTVISTTGAMLAAGTLSSNAALAVLGSFSIYNNSTFPFTQTALAAAIGSDATHITIAQIHAAVQAGTFPAADAIGALGKFAKNNGGSLQTQAIAEINALATDQTTRGLAVQALVDIINSTDPAIRSAGYTGLNAFLMSNPSFAVQAFALVAPRANSGDAAANADAMAELVILASTFGVGAGSALASDITSPIASLITASIAQQGGNIVGETPWLQVLVNLLDVPGVEQGITDFLLLRSHNDLANGEPFTVNTIIRDIAVTYGDNTGRLNTTVNELYQFLFYVTPAQMITALAGASGAEQTNILTGLLGLYNQQGSSPSQQAAIEAFSTRLTQLHPTAGSIGPLYQSGSLTAEQAMALLAPIIQASGVTDFLSAIVTVSPYIPASAIVSGLVDAVTAGDITSTIGLEALIAIGAGSAPTLQRAAEAGLADAMVQQKAIAGNLSTDLAYALGQGAATGAQAATFLADVYLARLQTVVSQSLLQPSDTQATATLKAAIVAQITTLLTNVSGASLTAVAKAAKDNFANINEVAAISDLIVALSSMFGDASFVTTQIAAAVPTISGYDAVSVLANIAGQLGGNYLAATGVQISSMVASGAILSTDAGFNLHSAVLNGVLSTAQANAIGIGAAGTNPFVGATLIANIANFDPALASTVVRDAVVGNTLLTLQGLDVAAGFAKLEHANAAAASVVALVAAGKTTTHAAIVEFGTLIGATAATISADQFVAILEALAIGTDLAGRTGIGADLAAVIGSGALTAQQAATAFRTGVTNLAIGAGLAFDVLIGASTGSFAGAIGKGFAPAIVSDADTSAAMTSIKTAISAGSLTLTQATKLLAGIVGGGTQRLKATAGLTLAEIAHDGPGSQLSAVVSEVPAGSLTAAEAAFVLTIFYDRMASFKLVDTQNGASSQIIANDNFSLVSAVSQISSLIGSGSITTAGALDQVEAAWTSQQANGPQPTLDQIVALMFALPTINEFGGAASVAVGEKFASLIAGGFGSSNFGSYVVSQAGTIPATQGIDVLAALAQASGTPGSLLNEIYAKLITLGTPTTVATTIGNLISPTGLSHASGLLVLAQLAAHGNAAVKNAVLAEFTLLINAGTVTATEVNTALSDPALPGTDALVLLVNAANTTNILPQNSYFSAIQTKVAALVASLGDHDAVAAIIAALDASSLSGGQIVDTLAKFLPVNANTDSLIGNEIGQLRVAGRISEADAATIVGRVLVTLSPNSQAAMARLLAYAGYFVGETAALLAAGTGSAALPADQVATILANLAAIDAASFNQPGLNAIYPYLGVAAGATIAGLVSAQFTIAQALASITGATGIDANNRALVLFGVASVGSASQQVEAGKALATVYQSGGSFDLLANSGKLITLLTPARATVLLAGMAVGGTAATKTYAGSLFAALLQTNGNQLSIAQVTAAIDGSVLPAADAASVLAVIGAGLAANGANSDTIRAGLDTELNSLVSSGRLSVSAAVNALVAQAGAGSVALQAATGRLIASLRNAGLATSTTLIGLVDAAVGGTLTAAQAVAIYTGAAVVNTGSFAPTLGDKIGAMVEASQITVANAITAIQAADTAYGVSAGAGEAALLVAAAGHVAAGLQTAAGQAIGALLTRGAIAVAATITSIDTAIGASNGVSATQAGAILIGVASSSPFQAQVAIGVEFAALIAANKLTSTAVIQSVDQAMASGLLTANPAFAVFVAMAATGSTLATSVATEIAGLVSGARMTADEALAALFAASGGQDSGFLSAQTDKAIAGIASALVGQSLASAGQVAADLVAAESVSHTISPNHALGVLVALAAGGPAAATQTYGAALPALLANGVTSAALTAAVAAPSISADNAVLFLASAVGAASSGQANAVEMASGAALAAIFTAGGLTAAQIVSDLRSAVTSGALSADREAALIAALATGISLPGNAATLGAELARLITSNALAASDVFADVLSITVGGSVPASSIALIEAMSATSDTALQTAVGTEIAGLIQGGTVSASAALAAFNAGGLTAAQNGLVLLAIASASPNDISVQVAVGQKLASLATSATENQLVGLFEAAIGHFLNAEQAVSILAAIATTGPSSNPATKYEAATTANNVLTRLYTDNLLQAAYSDAWKIAGNVGVSTDKLVYWLASLAASTSLISDGASQALGQLLSHAVLTNTAMVADIVAVATSADAHNSPVPTISRPTEVAALVGLVKNSNDPALVPLAAAAISAAIASGSITAAAAFNLVDVLAANPSSVGRAIGLLIGAANGLPSAQIAAANALVSSHIQSYVTNGQISADDVLAAEFQAANGSTSIAIAVGGYIAANGAASAVLKIADAQTSGSLTAAAAAAAYFGVVGAATTRLADTIAANQASIAARLAQLQPNVNYFFTDSNGVQHSSDSQIEALLVTRLNVQTAYAGIFTTIDNNLAALVSANAVTAAFVISTMQTTDTMSRSQKFDLLFALANNASATTRQAVGAAFVTLVDTSTVPNDTVWRGALSQAGMDFAKVYNGTMTVAAAIKDIEQYALAQHASVDSALGVLSSLFGVQSLNEGSKPNSGRRIEMLADSQTVDDELVSRYRSGASAAELALQVIKGNVSLSSALGQFATFDVNFPYSDGAPISAKANFLYDLRVLQLGASNLGTLDPTYYLNIPNPGFTMLEQQQALKFLVTGYAYDQALLTDINYLPYLRSDALGTSIVNKAIEKLGSRVFFGAAETDLINEIANGSMTPAQAIAALNAMLAPLIAGKSTDDTTLARQLAFGWLAEKAAGYIETNFVTTTDGNGKKTITTPFTPVTQLFNMLNGDAYRNDVIGGLGAISSIQNNNLVNAFDRASALKVAQTVITNYVTSMSLPGYLATDADVAAAVQRASIDTSSIGAIFVSGFALAQGQSGLPGIIHDQIAANPTDYRGYINLGTQITATGIPAVGGLLGLNGITDAFYASFDAQELGGKIAIAGVAAKILISAMAAPVVANWLQDNGIGPAVPGITGTLKIIAALSDALGNTVTGLTFAAQGQISDAGSALGASIHALDHGDLVQLATIGPQAIGSLFSMVTGAPLKNVEGAGISAAKAFANLATGDLSGFEDNIKALGANTVQIITSNVYFATLSTTIVASANQVGAIFGIGDGITTGVKYIGEGIEDGVDFVSDLFGSPAPAPKIIMDLSSIARLSYQYPHSRSNYGDFYIANAVDGYLSGSTVFIDSNENGVLDSGEYNTTTDGNGSYALPTGIIGPVVITGGIDTSTHLPFTATLTAPSGSTSVTALTTLVQKIAATNGGNVFAAEQLVSAAFGLAGTTVVTQLDPIANVRAGQNDGAALVLATTAALNTLILLEAAGATGDPTSVLAARIANAPLGTIVDLTNTTTLADLASASGVSASAGAAVVQIASASNTLLASLINSAPDPTTLLNRATAVTVVAQGETAAALVNAGNDPTLLATVVTNYTGTNLVNTVQTTLGEVISHPAEPYYGPPRWYMDPMVTGVVSTGSASGNSLSGSQSNQQMQTAFHDAAGSPSSVSFTPTQDLLTASSVGLVPALDNLFHPA